MGVFLLHILAAAVLQLGQTFNAELYVVCRAGGWTGMLGWRLDRRLGGRLLDLTEADISWGGRVDVLAGLGLEVTGHGNIAADTPLQMRISS